MIQEHLPVLLQEVIEVLKPEPGKRYIDATVGFGGHAFELVKKGANVLGIDRDPSEINLLETKRVQMRVTKSHLTLVNGSYTDIKHIAYEHSYDQVDGILFDLGFSSWHIEKSGRGFSFMKDEPLDLRFDPSTSKTTGADILNTYSYSELSTIFARYGELDEADKIAKALVQNRPIWKTSDLNAVIARTQTGRVINKLLARIYQALRITVNEELAHFEIGIVDAIDLIKPRGMLCVISFHSLEDRIVKLTFNNDKLKRINKKPIVPNPKEQLENKRSRSAKLRIAYRI